MIKKMYLMIKSKVAIVVSHTKLLSVVTGEGKGEIVLSDIHLLITL